MLSYNDFAIILSFSLFKEYPMSSLFYIFPVIIVVFVMLFVFVKRKKMQATGHTTQYPESEQLYVGNLSYQMNMHQLKEVFSKYGDVQNVRLIKNTRTGRSKGFAFITYANTKDAKKALSLHGCEVRGRAIVVRMAKPREE